MAVNLHWQSAKSEEALTATVCKYCTNCRMAFGGGAQGWRWNNRQFSWMGEFQTGEKVMDRIIMYENRNGK